MEGLSTAVFEVNFGLNVERWKEEGGKGEKEVELGKGMKLHGL